MMINYMRFLYFTTLFICLVSEVGLSCTTFCLDHGGQPVCGQNYDWRVEDGLVIINKRGVTKTAIPAAQQTLKPLEWTSKYGSVTFNQYGRELPMGGMNEAGLVVATMLLVETEYPLPDSRPALLSLQWRQYQLDNFSTVEEVIASNSQIRIRASEGPGLHFLVCDKTGNSVTIEFIGGKLVYHTKKKMPVKTLTNSVYAESINFWKKDKLPPYDIYHSIERFIRAANMVKNYDSETSIKSNVSYSFDILKSTSQMSTQWSIVYDVENFCIYFRTAGNPRIRHIDIKRLDFSCQTPVRVLDINAELSGDVTNNFLDYTPQINRNLIGNAFKKTYYLSGIPEETLDRLSQYPDSTICEY